MKKILIIGAGGVASYLLPVLTKAFKETPFILMDGDILEKRNLDRQLFHERNIGHNKASALANLYNKKTIYVLPRYFTGECHGHEISAIVCCADNHEARRRALAMADDYRIPAFIGGNEYFSSQAFYYEVSFKGTNDDPRVRYPEIMEDNSESPTSCQGFVSEGTPQMAIANQVCASYIAQLMYLWLELLPSTDLSMREDIKNRLPIELFSNYNGNYNLYKNETSNS